mgnify:FL=1
MLAGVVQMLSPQDEYASPGEGSDPNDMDPNSNYQFSGINNVSRSGLPLSLIYGWDCYVGSIVISNGIDTIQGEG